MNPSASIPLPASGIRHPASLPFRLLLYLTLCVGFCLHASPESAFAEANRLYEQERFPQAAEAYERLVADGHANAAVWFNLGNARFKSGETGRAIAAYVRARQLAPRDAEIANNLRMARLKAGNPPDESPASLLGRFSVNAWAVAAGLAVTLWFLLRALTELRPGQRAALRNPARACGLVALLLVLGAAVVADDQVWTRRVVVSVPEAVVRRGPLPESLNVFTPPDGTELEVTDRKDEWFRVRGADGQEGWILRRHVLPLGHWEAA